ncbi:MAG: hypothetical protein JJT94_17645 [Bernardetiaceae bacterium]|nr:hypothetical protein [Bernardetiaceae bacterium]
MAQYSPFIEIKIHAQDAHPETGLYSRMHENYEVSDNKYRAMIKCSSPGTEKLPSLSEIQEGLGIDANSAAGELLIKAETAILNNELQGSAESSDATGRYGVEWLSDSPNFSGKTSIIVVRQLD